jgi:hypothetical protein
MAEGKVTLSICDKDLIELGETAKAHGISVNRLVQNVVREALDSHRRGCTICIYGAPIHQTLSDETTD